MASGTGIRAGRAFVVIGAVDKTGQVLSRVSRRMKAFGASLSNIGRSVATGGLAAAVPLALSVKTFLSFDDAMRKVKARTGATEGAFQSMRNQAKKLGRETSFTAANVAELQGILARRGFVPKEIEAQVPNILNLAKAAGEGKDQMEDLANAATLTAGTMAAFGLEASSSGDIADLFSQAVNNSALSLESLLNSLKFVAPVAKAGGLNLQQTVQTLGELSNLWIENSMGGTTFRRMVINLVKSNEKLNKAGIQIEAEGGGFRPIQDIIRDITKASTDLSEIEKLDVFEKIFGARAIAGAAGLSNESKKSAKLAAAMANRFGAAKKAAEEMEAGIGGTFRRLVSAIQGVAIEVGESLAPGLSDIGESISQNLNVFAEWIQQNANLVILLTKIVAATIATGAALILLGVSIQLIGIALGVLKTIIAVPFLIGKAAILVFRAAMFATFATGKALALAWKVATMAAFGLSTTLAVAWKATTISAMFAVKAAMIGLRLTALAVLVTVYGLGQAAVLAWKVVTLAAYTIINAKAIASQAILAAAWAAGTAAAIASNIAVAAIMVTAWTLGTAAGIIYFGSIKAGFLVAKAATIAWGVITATVFLAGQVLAGAFSAAVIIGYTAGTVAAIAWRTASLVGFALIKIATIAWKILTVGAFVASSAASIAFGAVTVASFLIAKVAAIAFWVAANAPLALFVAGFVAIVAVIAKVSGALDTLGAGFGAIGETIAKTFKGIMDAFAVGDMQAAWDILVLGLEVAWLQFVDTLKQAWTDFLSFFIEAAVGAKLAVDEIMNPVQEAIADTVEDTVDTSTGGLFDTVTGFLGFGGGSEVLGEDKLGATKDAEGLTKIERDFIEGTGAAAPQAEMVAGSDVLQENLVAGQNEAAEFLRTMKEGNQEASDARQAEIQERRAALNTKLEEIAARRTAQEEEAAKEADEAKVTSAIKTEEKVMAAAKELDVKKPTAGVAPTISRGLERGTVEAAKKFAANRAVAQQILIASQQLEEQKKGNNLLAKLKGNEENDEGGSI